MPNYERLYGAWVTKNDMIPVSYQSHYETGISILGYEKRADGKRNRPYEKSIYKIMYRLGYVRLQYNYSDSHSTIPASHNVCYGKDIKLSKYQKQIIKEANYADCESICYNFRHLKKG